MVQNRLIPVLLLSGKGLVKTVQFKKPKYVGDPINAIKIFNDKEVDELVFLDINASKENRGPNFEMLQNISSECFMPVGYGGGITQMQQIERIFKIGIEKVILNQQLLQDATLITEAAKLSGNQSIVAGIDFKKSRFGGIKVYDHKSRKTTKLDVLEHAKRLVDLGAGELVLNNVDRDGVCQGYHVDFLHKIASQISVPVVAVGGAGNLQHVKELLDKESVSGAAAGSIFVFHGPHKAVLINYPKQEKIKELFHDK